MADTYFQFPLCALSFGQTEDERLNAILDYSLVVNGWTLFCKLTTERHREFIAEVRRATQMPAGYDAKLWTHQATLYGAKIMGINLGGFLPGIDRYQKLRPHVVAFEKLYGRDALVRIKKSWLPPTSTARYSRHRARILSPQLRVVQ